MAELNNGWEAAMAKLPPAQKIALAREMYEVKIGPYAVESETDRFICVPYETARERYAAELREQGLNPAKYL